MPRAEGGLERPGPAAEAVAWQADALVMICRKGQGARPRGRAGRERDLPGAAVSGRSRIGCTCASASALVHPRDAPPRSAPADKLPPLELEDVLVELSVNLEPAFVAVNSRPSIKGAKPRGQTV